MSSTNCFIKSSKATATQHNALVISGKISSSRSKHDTANSLYTINPAGEVISSNNHLQVSTSGSSSISHNSQANFRPVHRKSYDDTSDSSIPLTREDSTTGISAPAFAEVVHSSELSVNTNSFDGS